MPIFAVMMTRRADLIGCNLFDAFPDNPDDPDADGVANLGASRVCSINARPDRMPRQRYGIGRPDDLFAERWWDPLKLPVFDGDGGLRLVLHHVEDVTGRRLAA
jgi:hypothetical protein